MRRRIAWQLGLATAAVIGTAGGARGQIVRQSFTATATPVIDESFNVLEPPDTMGCVGINHFAQFLNGTFSVYNKTNGAEVVNMTDAEFWQNVAHVSYPGNGISDP